MLETEWRRRQSPAGDEVVLHDHRSRLRVAWTSHAGRGLPDRAADWRRSSIGGQGGAGRLGSRWPNGANGGCDARPQVPAASMDAAERAIRQFPHRTDFRAGRAGSRTGRSSGCQPPRCARCFVARAVARPTSGSRTRSEKSSSDFCRGLLRGLFDTDGSVQGTQEKGVSVRLTQADSTILLGRSECCCGSGSHSTYPDRKPAGTSLCPTATAGRCEYRTAGGARTGYSGANLLRFREQSASPMRQGARLEQSLAGYRRALNRERFMATVDRLKPDGVEDVFDVNVPRVHAFDANGFYVHNCGEQPLPPTAAAASAR